MKNILEAKLKINSKSCCAADNFIHSLSAHWPLENDGRPKLVVAWHSITLYVFFIPKISEIHGEEAGPNDNSKVAWRYIAHRSVGCVNKITEAIQVEARIYIIDVNSEL